MEEQEKYAIVKLSDLEPDEKDGTVRFATKPGALVAVLSLGGVADAQEVVGVFDALAEHRERQMIDEIYQRELAEGSLPREE